MTPPKQKPSTVARAVELVHLIRCAECGPFPLAVARSPQIARDVVDFHRKNRGHSANVERVAGAGSVRR